MTNLFEFTTKYGTTYCFANTAKEAEEIILKERYENRLMYNHTINPVSDDILEEDGVSFLREKDFVGIPQRKVFMLGGSMQHSISHYQDKGRSSSFWWSEKIPESENLWSAEFV